MHSGVSPTGCRFDSFGVRMTTHATYRQRLQPSGDRLVEFAFWRCCPTTGSQHLNSARSACCWSACSTTTEIRQHCRRYGWPINHWVFRDDEGAALDRTSEGLGAKPDSLTIRVSCSCIHAPFRQSRSERQAKLGSCQQSVVVRLP